LLECALGCWYVVDGTVTFAQAGLGIILAAVIAAAYLALYPRRPRLVVASHPAQPAAQSPSP